MERRWLLAAFVALTCLSLGLVWSLVPSPRPGTPTKPGEPEAELAATPVLELSDLELAAARTVRSPAPASTSSARSRPAHADPIVVSGTVVDHRGKVVPGARVRVCDPDGSRPAVVESDAAGRFALHGTRESLHLVARANRDGFAGSGPVRFLRGERIELVLPEGGAVGGRVLHDPWIPRQSVGIFLIPVDARGRDAGRPVKTTLEEDGSFFFDAIKTRSARVYVQVAHETVSAATVDGISVPSSGYAQDARLDPLDLRGMLVEYAVEVLDEQGAKACGARVVIEGRSRLALDGTARFLLPEGQHDADVELAGRRRARVTSIAREQTVRLRRGIPVRLELGPGEPLPPPPHRLAVALVAGAPEPFSGFTSIVPLDGARSAVLAAASAGPHRVAWYLEDGARQRFLGETKRSTLEVIESAETQTFRLSVPSAVVDGWRDAIAALERDR